jgi:cobalt/nickel transport system permease protein
VVLAKAMTSVIAMILIASTTRFSRLLQGLEGLRFPRFLILILSFLYRYIFVLVDEVHRMRRSLESRSAGRRPVGGIRVYGSLLGVLFLRAYERAERVYAAMIARGFSGEIRTLGRLGWSRADSLFLLLAWGSVAGVVLWETIP